MKSLLLVDFSWLYNKYYFVAKYKEEKDISKAVLSMLRQFLSRVEINYPKTKKVLALDSPTSSLNNFKLCPLYKQNRNKSEKKEVYKELDSILKGLVKSLNSESFYFIKAKGYEADQIIANFAKKYHEKCEITIFSGDKDLLQLTYYENVKVSDKYKDGKFIYITDKEIFGKFKNNKKEDFTRISENKKDILKYRVLKGDTSDNLSAVFPRIKDSQISQIIKEYWIDEEELTETRIEDIINDLKHANSQLAERLETNKDIWLRNWKIMNLFNIEDFKMKRIL